MPVIKRKLAAISKTGPVPTAPTSQEPTTDSYDWGQSFDRVRITFEQLGEAVRLFSEVFWEEMMRDEAFEVRLDDRVIPRELILALIQVSLLRDPDFDYDEDYSGFLEAFAELHEIRFGEPQHDADGHYGQVEVFAGDERLAKVFIGGFQEHWTDQAFAWAAWKSAIDVDRLGTFLDGSLPQD